MIKDTVDIMSEFLIAADLSTNSCLLDSMQVRDSGQVYTLINMYALLRS